MVGFDPSARYFPPFVSPIIYRLLVKRRSFLDFVGKRPESFNCFLVPFFLNAIFRMGTGKRFGITLKGSPDKVVQIGPTNGHYPMNIAYVFRSLFDAQVKIPVGRLDPLV
jgi:hypothetical protein